MQGQNKNMHGFRLWFSAADGQREWAAFVSPSWSAKYGGQFIPVRKLVGKVLQDVPGLHAASVGTISVVTVSFHRESWEDQVTGHPDIKASVCLPHYLFQNLVCKIYHLGPQVVLELVCKLENTLGSLGGYIFIAMPGTTSASAISHSGGGLP